MTRRSPETGSGVPPIPPAPGDMSNQGRSLADAVQAGETANQRSSGEKKGFLRRTKERIKQIGRTAARAWRLGFEQWKAETKDRRRIRPIDAADEPENPERSLVRSDEPITKPGTTETVPTQTETPEPKEQDKSSAETVQKKEREDEDSIAAKRQEILKKLKKAADDIDKYGIGSDEGRKAAAKTIKYGEQLDRLRERTKKEKTPAGDEEGSEIERSESLPARDELIDGMQIRRQDLNKKLSIPGFRFPGGEIGKNREIGEIKEELDAINEEWDRFGGKAIEEAQDKGSETEQKLQKEIEELEAKAGLKFPGGEFEKKRKIEILKDKLEKAKNAAKADIEAARDAFYARFVADQVKEEIPPAPTPAGDDARRARIDDLEKILNDPETTDSAKYLADLERNILLGELNADEDTEEDEDSPDTEITPEDKERMDKAEKALNEARSRYAELRAEYEQMGFARKLFGGKALKEELENAREKLQTILSYVTYHRILGWEKENAESSDENKQDVEQGKVGKETIQAIAFATLDQYEVIEKETQGWYDRKLDERPWFKKVAAKIGQWFVGKENKDGGKLGLGGWLRSGGTGLAAGVATGLFGISFPITSVLGVAGGAGVKVAAHQRALENGREENRSLGQGYRDGVVKDLLDRDWTVEYQDRSGNMVRRSASKKEIVMNMVGGMLENTQRDTERRQRNMVAIGRKAAMGWGLGFAAGRAATELIKSHITPDQKPANAADPSKSPDNPDPSKTDATDPSNPGTGEGGGQGGAPAGEITPPSETVSLGPDGWVWNRVADVLGAEKAMPFLEQLAQTNPDFQLIDLPDGLIGIAYQGNTDPQVVADAIGRVAPDLLRQWILAA